MRFPFTFDTRCYCRLALKAIAAKEMSTPLILAEEDIESGGKESRSGIENVFTFNNNVYGANIKIRMGFLRKVYGLLTVQLLLTVAIGAVFMTCKPMKEFVMLNPWSILVAFVISIGVLITLHYKRKEHPLNLILLTVFTLLQAYTIGTVVSMFDVPIVLEAVFITVTVLMGLTAYTFQSKRDFSFLGAGLFAGIWVLLLAGIMQIFFHSTALELCISIAGVLLFCGFIMYDTHVIMHTLSPEEYILATMNLYLDILNLFLYILRILAASRK